VSDAKSAVVSDAGACDDCKVAQLKGELDKEAARVLQDNTAANNLSAAEVALEKAEWDAEHDLQKAYHGAIVTVAQGSIDRIRESAKYVQVAATAIAALYTGALGLVFAAKDNPLPGRGIWSPVFLGLAIALATAYLAYIKGTESVPWYDGGSSLEELQLNRTNQFVQWTNTAVGNKRYVLRVSVLCLALGVAFMAAPFVAYGGGGTVSAAATPPAIPTAVPAAIQDDAQRLFATEVSTYIEAINNLKADQKTEVAAAATRDAQARSLNWRVGWLAALGLLLAFVGPIVFGAVFDD
jgi:hypothetical protein